MPKLFSDWRIKPTYHIPLQSPAGRSLYLADPKVNRLALALMDMQAVMGGAASHWGGPSAFIEINSALFALTLLLAKEKNLKLPDLFHIINDAGHCENGLYALKANYQACGLTFSDLKGFRSLESPLTGHGEAHLFPQGVYLSNGPLGSTLAQAEGLAMADRLAKKNRMTIVLMSDGACMEGEAKEALSSIPGFMKKNKMNPFLLIISDNNTKLSGRINEDSFSMDPFLSSLSQQGWEMIDCNKAHDIKSCVTVLEPVLTKPEGEFSKPICIRAKTIKGFGLETTMESASGGHGWPVKNPENLMDFLSEIYGSSHIPEEFKNWYENLKKTYKARQKKAPGIKKIKVQAGVSKALINCVEKGLPVVSLSADLQGSTGVGPFREKYPEFSFDMGVAEANMISTASGFSKQGFIPVVDTFTQFGVTKGALPLFMANLSLAPVIAVFSHAGLQDAADGASHQSLTYLANTSALPLTDVYILSAAEEAFYLISQAVESFALAYKKKKVPRTQIFLLGRETFAPSYLPKNYPYQLGKAQIVYSDIKPHKQALTLLAAGPLLPEALEAGKILNKKNWKVIVINPSIINHPDIETLKNSLKKTNHQLLTVEDHYLTGGLGALTAHKLALEKIPFDMHSLGVQSTFGRSAYKSYDLYKKEKLSAEHIANTALKRWN